MMRKWRLPGDTLTGQRQPALQTSREQRTAAAMLPAILEPIPADVVGCLEDGSLAAAAGHLSQARDAEPLPREILDEALYVLYRRALDTSYLAPGADIWMWTRGETVVVERDNRGRRIDGAPAWTASRGRRAISTSEFRELVTAFHRKLIAAMQERIDFVCAHWLRPEVKINLLRLREEQAERDAWLKPTLIPRLDPAAWDPVRAELRSRGPLAPGA